MIDLENITQVEAAIERLDAKLRIARKLYEQANNTSNRRLVKSKRARAEKFIQESCKYLAEIDIHCVVFLDQMPVFFVKGKDFDTLHEAFEAVGAKTAKKSSVIPSAESQLIDFAKEVTRCARMAGPHGIALYAIADDKMNAARRLIDQLATPASDASLVEAIKMLLDCPALNREGLEVHDCDAITFAQQQLKRKIKS